MIKLIVRKPAAFQQWRQHSFLKKFIFFDFNNLHLIRDETLFFNAITQLKMKNGIYKKTNAKRFNDVDDALVTLLLQNKKQYAVHDVAVSDGITSVDLMNTFKQKGIDVKLTISDKFAKVYSRHKWYGSIVKDGDGNVLYADFFGIQAFSGTSVKFILSKLLGYLFPATSPIVSTDKEIFMLNPKTMEAIENGEMTFQYVDVFVEAPAGKKYDVVRCMNVLNYKVFPDEAIASALKHLIASVAEGGYFIIGRTEDNTAVNNVTFLQKTNNEMRVVKEINKGSEVKFLINNIADTVLPA